MEKREPNATRQKKRDPNEQRLGTRAEQDKLPAHA